jgi:hypothetical protein
MTVVSLGGRMIKTLAVLVVALFAVLLPSQTSAALTHPATSTGIAAWDRRVGGQIIYWMARRRHC